ncbi:MAG: DUF2285 domain-containing protein [Hyphomonadaceae bacterium]
MRLPLSVSSHGVGLTLLQRSGRSCAVGGCSFVVDSRLSSRDRPAHWPAESLPVSVMLVGAPDTFEDVRSIDLASVTTHYAHASGVNEHALVLRADDGQHHISLHGQAIAGRFAVLLPVDSDFEVRAAAALRFYRSATGRAAGPAPTPWRLTDRQRSQLALALRALDGHLEGVSQRAIALVLFGRTISGRAWIGSDLQARTKRAISAGLALMQGGYRALLAAPRRRRSGNADSPP